MPQREMELIRQSMGRVEHKVDSLLEVSKDHSGRIRDLERVKNWVLGACASVGLL